MIKPPLVFFCIFEKNYNDKIKCKLSKSWTKWAGLKWLESKSPWFLTCYCHDCYKYLMYRIYSEYIIHGKEWFIFCLIDTKRAWLELHFWQVFMFCTKCTMYCTFKHLTSRRWGIKKAYIVEWWSVYFSRFEG